jgi:CheY-like chemotaxis protein
MELHRRQKQQAAPVKPRAAGCKLMNILVIEDEAKTAKFLKKGLGEAGFIVDVACDGVRRIATRAGNAVRSHHP